MRDFPPRVTLSEDGVYRWSYDMDLWRNLFMLKLVLKVLAVLCAVLLFIMAAAAGRPAASAGSPRLSWPA